MIATFLRCNNCASSLSGWEGRWEPGCWRLMQAAPRQRAVCPRSDLPPRALPAAFLPSSHAQTASLGLLGRWRASSSSRRESRRRTGRPQPTAQPANACIVHRKYNNTGRRRGCPGTRGRRAARSCGLGELCGPSLEAEEQIETQGLGPPGLPVLAAAPAARLPLPAAREGNSCSLACFLSFPSPTCHPLPGTITN